ncbi:uncharacterized protein TRIADDRAFT_57776 [Trichoplax adhaerens]|uniref:Uncharacterized protein n=1 Tax=Trichoplax adhaerens TaxID=10228 RepID=B3S0D8_TRIAD|nr:predicted protein [Trichoplax adhaerens]EDV23998.1 predicted protein [Trichoplax adhaerens]|eukprot:XP_002113524.1 predicted protein [Trichoplax adhaerens]
MASPKKFTGVSSLAPPPMKFFATWEVDRAQPNCVPSKMNYERVNCSVNDRVLGVMKWVKMLREVRDCKRAVGGFPLSDGQLGVRDVVLISYILKFAMNDGQFCTERALLVAVKRQSRKSSLNCKSYKKLIMVNYCVATEEVAILKVSTFRMTFMSVRYQCNPYQIFFSGFSVKYGHGSLDPN